MIKNQNKTLALLLGKKRYHGNPCKRCNETEKFVSSSSCIKCTNSRVKNRSKDIFDNYINSEKGQSWLKEFRKTPTYRKVQNKWVKRDYKSNKNKYRNRNYIAKYNISLEHYNFLLEEQNYRCKICHKSYDEYQKRLSIDHCHKSGKIRGLLCVKCNTSLGLLEENIDIMNSMINYIKEYSEE